MNKLFTVIFNDIKKNKSLYISLVVVIIVSIIFGTLFITIISNNDKTLVTAEISNFFNDIKNGKHINTNYLLNNMLNNNIYSILLWILGISVIGIPIIICMLFYKGFTLAFTISSIIYILKLKGILVSAVYIFPHLIINIIIYFIMTYYSFVISTKIFKILFCKEEIKIQNYIKKYIFVLLISIIVLSLSALYETYVMSYLIKLIY